MVVACPYCATEYAYDRSTDTLETPKTEAAVTEESIRKGRTSPSREIELYVCRCGGVVGIGITDEIGGQLYVPDGGEICQRLRRRRV